MPARPDDGKSVLPFQPARIPGINTFNRSGIIYPPAMQRGTVRRTKIVSTLGPATDSADMIGKLMEAGVNIFRLNMSHAPHDWVRRVFADIRAESKKRNLHTGIL